MFLRPRLHLGFCLRQKSNWKEKPQVAPSVDGRHWPSPCRLSPATENKAGFGLRTAVCSPWFCMPCFSICPAKLVSWPWPCSSAFPLPSARFLPSLLIIQISPPPESRLRIPGQLCGGQSYSPETPPWPLKLSWKSTSEGSALCDCNVTPPGGTNRLSVLYGRHRSSETFPSALIPASALPLKVISNSLPACRSLPSCPGQALSSGCSCDKCDLPL